MRMEMMQNSLERTIGKYLRENRMTLSTAESCTGGLISDRITDVPGSSAYFEGGMVTYSIRAKAGHLGIPPGYIERYGVVSSQVAKKMAQGIRKAFHTTFGLSTTGVAGPTGGTKKTPVGTVFVGFSDGKTTLATREVFKGGRREIKEQAAERSLQFFYEQLRKLGHQGNWIWNLSQKIDSKIVIIHKASRGILNRKGRVGIFSASFNPPTKAHLALVREARKAGGLEEILVLLDIAAMDKRPVGAKIEDRLQMVEMLFRKNPEISVGLSNRGLFLEKLKPLRTLYPFPIELTFVVGFDTILRVMDKKYYKNRKRALDRLFNECRFLVANRGDQDRKSFDLFFSKVENETYRGRVSFFTLPKKFSSLSSSLVRKKIREGRSVRGWVPAGTLQLIKKTGLYKKKSVRACRNGEDICE